MTNYEWLIKTDKYSKFMDDCAHLCWVELAAKWDIHEYPMFNKNLEQILAYWFHEPHAEVHRYMDIDKINEYLRKNDTSIDCDYIRINRNKFKAFLDKQEIKYITE